MSPRAQGDQTDGVLSPAAQRAVSIALQQSPVAIMLTDVDGRIHYANPRFYQLTGYQPADLERVNVFDLSAHAEEEFLMWAVKKLAVPNRTATVLVARRSGLL